MNLIISITCVSISLFSYYIWGWTPGSIYWLGMALMFGYWVVPKTKNVYHYTIENKK